MIGEKRLKEIMDFYYKHGEEQTLVAYELKHETLSRYLRDWREFVGVEAFDKNATIRKILDTYSKKELTAISKGGRIHPGQDAVPIVDFSGDRVRIGCISDTHYGSKYSDPELTYQAFREFEKEKVDFVTHSGDVTEGMSNRAGHIYELTHIGYESMKQHACEVLSQCPAPLYMISGNHDYWFKMSNGAEIVPSIADKIGATYLGHDEGDIALGGVATLKLWHGLDGNSYAHSYRVQKIVESLTGGEKPSVMFTGHTHKSFYIYDRHIHCYSMGALQRQSKWMRGKRIQSHTGFWIVYVWLGEKGITKTRGTWYPFYQ